MTKKKRGRRRGDSSGLIAAGIGLILVGLALFVFWPTSPADQETQPDSAGLSVVPAEVNYPAPQLSLQSLEGKPESLEDYKGNVLLVNNWAIWCPPCKAEMPTLEDYYEAHNADGFMIVAIEAGEPKEAVSEFAESHGLKFRLWLDPNNASLAAFRNSGLPNSYVIDRAGTVRYAWTGEISRAMLEKYVTPLIAE